MKHRLAIKMLYIIHRRKIYLRNLSLNRQYENR